MQTIINKNQKVLNDMKDCISSFGLPIIDEINENGQSAIVTKFQYEHYGFGIIATYHPEGDLVEIVICYGVAPQNRIKPLSELMNYINAHVLSGHFFVDDLTMGMSFRSAVHITEELDKEEFEWALQQVMGSSYKFFPIIIEQMFSEDEPANIFKKHLKKMAKTEVKQ